MKNKTDRFIVFNVSDFREVRAQMLLRPPRVWTDNGIRIRPAMAPNRNCKYSHTFSTRFRKNCAKIGRKSIFSHRVPPFYLLAPSFYGRARKFHSGRLIWVATHGHGNSGNKLQNHFFIVGNRSRQCDRDGRLIESKFRLDSCRARPFFSIAYRSLCNRFPVDRSSVFSRFCR